MKAYQNKVNVYVGNYGDYMVPPEVLAKAESLNAGKSLADMRTKGAKYLRWWGRCQDATQETIIAINCRNPFSSAQAAV